MEAARIGRRAESGAGPVGHAGVERDADDGDVGARHLIGTGQACEVGRTQRNAAPWWRPRDRSAAALGLELVAGRPAVDREIEAAAVSELSHPGPWLQRGCMAANCY